MFKRINKYFKSSLSLTFNNLHKKENYQQNFGKISNKKNSTIKFLLILLLILLNKIIGNHIEIIKKMKKIISIQK